MDDEKPIKIKAKRKQKLTYKQANFVAQYLLLKSATEAAKIAYDSKYPAPLGNSLMKLPQVKEAILRKEAILEEKQIVTLEEKLKVLRNHMYDENKEISIKAVAELNKMQGHLAPTKNINLNLDATLDTLDQIAIELKPY